jgi:hypothetical protein
MTDELMSTNQKSLLQLEGVASQFQKQAGQARSNRRKEEDRDAACVKKKRGHRGS